MNQNGNQKQNDYVLTKQFDGLDIQTEEGYKHALSVATFRCEAEGCDVEGTADATVNSVDRRGKKIRAALFTTFQTKAVVQITDRKTGRPIIDRETGVVATRDAVVLRQVLCRKHTEIAEPAAKKAGFQVQVYPLPANLDFLRRMGQERVARDAAKEFFTAMARGQKSVEDGIKAGFLTALPPEGEETKPDENGDLPNILAVHGKMVGLLDTGTARSYMFARKDATELFNGAGFYLYWCTLAKAKALAAEHAAKQAEWEARQTERRAEDKRRQEARDAAAAKSQGLFAGLAKKFNVKAPEAAKGGDRRGKSRDKRDIGPKPVKPDLTPEAREQIDEELLSATPEASEIEEQTTETEAPQGAMVSGPLTAPLGILATNRK